MGAFFGFWENYIQNSEKNEFDALIEGVNAEIEQAAIKLSLEEEQKLAQARGAKRRSEIVLEYISSHKKVPRIFHIMAQHVKEVLDSDPSQDTEPRSNKTENLTHRR